MSAKSLTALALSFSIHAQADQPMYEMIYDCVAGPFSGQEAGLPSAKGKFNIKIFQNLDAEKGSGSGPDFWINARLGVNLIEIEPTDGAQVPVSGTNKITITSDQVDQSGFYLDPKLQGGLFAVAHYDAGAPKIHSELKLSGLYSIAPGTSSDAMAGSMQFRIYESKPDYEYTTTAPFACKSGSIVQVP